MAESTFRNGVIIGDYRRPYIVAEVNSSHNGSVQTAKKMIDEAKRVGCDCVKFQSWSAETLYSKNYYDNNPIAKRIVKKFSLSSEELYDLANYCKQKEISFASTPYSKGEVDFLVKECNVPYIKIASMDINNFSLLRHAAHTGMPIMLSTGMAELNEVEKAVQCIKSSGNQNISILHCISIYPTAAENIQLNSMLELRDRFPMYPIGFSDHTIGCEVACASVALGAAVIEKHFTLDNSKMGMDNNMATEPPEMEKLVIGCRNVQLAMGKKEKQLSIDELEQRKKMRRSIVAAGNLTAGTILREMDLDVKRPGDGIAPDYMSTLIGKKICRDIEFDEQIKLEDVED